MKNSLRVLAVVGSMLALVFITMVNFYHKIQEREFTIQLNSLKDLSNQGNVILENKLEGFVSTLYGLAEIFHDGDVHDPEKTERIKNWLRREAWSFRESELQTVREIP